MTELKPILGDPSDAWPPPPTSSKLLARELAASSVRLVSELCVGRYGPVYHAELLAPAVPDPAGGPLPPRTCRPVAAKTLSATASPDTVVRR